MKVRFYYLFFLLVQLICINNVLAENNTETKIDKFDESTHISASISNFMYKIGISRDFGKNFESGVNFYSGPLSSYSFKKSNCCMGPSNIANGISFEVDVKNYFDRPNYSPKITNTIYSKYFLGTSFISRYNYDSIVDGNFSTYYLGAGIGDTVYLNNMAFNFAFDLGVNTDISFNSVALIFFPRLSLGAEVNF